jgi:hypothetical protein
MLTQPTSDALLQKAYRTEDGILGRLVDDAVDVGPGAHQRSMAYQGEVASPDPDATARAGSVRDGWTAPVR